MRQEANSPVSTMSTDKTGSSSSGEPGHSHRLLGRILMIVGSVPVVATIVMGSLIQDVAFAYLSNGFLILFVVAFLPLGVILALVGRSTYKRGKKLAAAAHAELILHDPRPHILYLRSFKDDSKTARSGSPGIMNWLLATATEEEQFAEAMGELGPFIAIGQPGDKLPQLGAARIYVGNDEWQERVGQLMLRARLVVLRVGNTPGFWWEVERAARNLKPEQLLFLLPLRKKKYEAFRQRMKDLIPRWLPEYQRMPRLGSGLRAVLYFDGDWTPHLLRFKRPFFLLGIGNAVMPFAQYISATNPYVAVFKKTLQPVLDSLQLNWQKPPASSRRFYITMVSAMFLFAGISISLGNKMEKDANAHYARGDGLREKGDLDAAIAEYRVAQRFDPKGPGSHLKLGSAFAEKKDWDDSIAELDEAVHLGPSLAGAHLAFGRALLQKQGNLEKALAEYRSSVRLDPSSPDGHYNLGLLLVQKGDFDAAIQELHEVMRLRPDNTEAQTMLGIALVSRAAKDLREVGDRMSTLLDTHPNVALAHYSVGVAAELTGDRMNALAEYHIAAQLAPNESEIQENYERLSRELKQ